ncbi:MAG: chorismate mutase [Clostridiales Family XIII bacterium]|jgi:chorismate mutase/prephenate dehydratase|nr:chorismate mutase [Clostridiales Family XIII bacterium]
MNDKAKEELNILRGKIDAIDKNIIVQFVDRMEAAEAVANVKRTNNIAILDETREQEVVDAACESVDSELKGEVALLMRSVMALSREYQRTLMFTNDVQMLPDAAAPKTSEVKCAFQGARGAWSEQATVSLFPEAERFAVDFFEDVFIAVKEGKADYGIIPLENSQTGAIGENYDLLKKYGCFIVKKTWIDIRHCLLANPAASIGDIKEVYSHPEGFKQSHNFLMKHNWDQMTTTNTAVAAETVAKDKDIHKAAIGSRLAAEYNGLNVLVEDIMDSDKNKTSFVVIAKKPEYTTEDNLTSVTFSLAHRSGALCETLLPFMAGDINLSKIESRPANTPGEYRFFTEVQGNILDEKVIDTLRHAAATCQYFEVLGCYSQV